MSEEFGPDFITITDEEGNDIELELVDALEHNGQTYMAFFPAVEEDGDEDGGEDVFAVPKELQSNRGYKAIKVQSNIFKLFAIVFMALYCICMTVTVINELSKIEILSNPRLMPIALFLIVMHTVFSLSEVFFKRQLLRAEERYYKTMG